MVGSEAMGALSRPEEVVALVKLRVAAGQIKRQIPPEEHWAFCYSMLQNVSRSFALVIQQLGPELRNAVSTAASFLSNSFPSFNSHAAWIRSGAALLSPSFLVFVLAGVWVYG